MHSDFPLKYDMRKSVILYSEKDFWDHITIDYVTEESDDESDAGRQVVRHIPWGSKCMNYNTCAYD